MIFKIRPLVESDINREDLCDIYILKEHIANIVIHDDSYVANLTTSHEQTYYIAKKRALEIVEILDND